MDFSRMRLEPLEGVVIYSPTTTSSNTTQEAEDSSSFFADSQDESLSSPSSSESLSASSSCSNAHEEETSTLPSPGNTQDHHLDPRKIIKKPDPPGQCAASEMENLSPPPIECFTIPISPTNGKKKNDNENDDNESSSSSDSTASDDDISCLSSNASPIFKACRQRLLAERENLSNFYSALFQRHLDQSARIIQKFVRGMIQRRKFRDICYAVNGNTLNKAILQLECLVSQFADCCILPDVFTTTNATATTEAAQTTTTMTSSSDHVTTTTKFLVRPSPVRALSSMSVTTVDEARNLADQGMQDDDDDLNIPTFIVGGDSSHHHRRRCVDNQVQIPPTAAPCGDIVSSTTMMPTTKTTPISSLRPTATRGFSSKSIVSTAELRPTLSSRGFSSLSIMTVESTSCSTGSSSCSSSNAYDFDVDNNNNNNKATPPISSMQPTAFRGMSTRSDMKILDENACFEHGDDFVAQQERENDAATTTSCQDDNNDLFELDTLEYVCSFDNVYINVNSDINANDETALTTQGDDGNDDDDDDDSITHLSITKWLATEGLDKHHDDHDDETASTFADITDSSTDYDFLETIGNNSHSSASITLEAPPPPAECYFIPSIEDYAPVQKQTRTTTCKVQQ